MNVTRQKKRRFPDRHSGQHYKAIALNHFNTTIKPRLDPDCEYKPLQSYINDKSGVLMIDVGVKKPGAVFNMVMSFPIDSIGPIGERGLKGPGPCPAGEPGVPGISGNNPSKYIHNPISQTLLEDILCNL